MRIMVNGEPRQIDDGTTLADLVRNEGLGENPCAAEVNESLVPRTRHAETELRDGDRVELVTLVGGG